MEAILERNYVINNRGIRHDLLLVVEDASSLNEFYEKCELYKITPYLDDKKMTSIFKNNCLMTTLDSIALSIKMDLLF